MLKKFLFVLPFTLAGLVSNAQTILENKTVNAVPATHLDFYGINDYVNCGNAPAVQISGNAIPAPARNEIRRSQSLRVVLQFKILKNTNIV